MVGGLYKKWGYNLMKNTLVEMVFQQTPFPARKYSAIMTDKFKYGVKVNLLVSLLRTRVICKCSTHVAESYLNHVCLVAFVYLCWGAPRNLPICKPTLLPQEYNSCLRYSFHFQ